MLTVTSILGCVFLAVNGFFTPETNHYLLMFCLFIGGVVRSFFFTGVNAFGYADISEADASQATSIAAVNQQISVALGVAVAGGVLEIVDAVARRAARRSSISTSPGSSSPASPRSAPSASCGCRPMPARTSPGHRVEAAAQEPRPIAVMNSRLVPLILAVALFMENMDSTVIATSLAAIAHDIGTEPIALKLALTAYLVALAIFIPISSWMADRWGARNVFRVRHRGLHAGLGRLRAVELAARRSSLARFLQGMGGAMMTPIARLVLVRVTPRNQLVDAMAWLSIPGLVGPIVGPPIGGFITTYFSWHWIFLINVPIGIIGIVLVSRFLPDWQRNAPRRMDFAGFFLAGIAFAGWVFGISVLTLPALPLGFGFAALVAGTHQRWRSISGTARRTEYPLLDLRLFRFPLFRTTVIAGTFFRLGTGAMPFLFPLMLQLAFGLTPFAERHRSPLRAPSARSPQSSSPKPILKRLGFRTR